MCESWAWVDLDVVLGDLSTWINGNKVLDKLDMWSVSNVSGFIAIYPRQEFTVHKQTQEPRVNEVWRLSDEFSRIEKLTRSIVFPY